MNRLRIWLVGIVGLSLTASACAPSPAQEPNKSAPPQPMPPPPGYPTHQYSQPQPVPAAIPKPKAVEPGPMPQSAEEAEEEIAQLMTELDTIIGGVKVESMGDTRCLRSCKALASMRRAVDRLCDLTDGDERCTRARDRLERSERKVSDAGCSCS